MNSWTGARMEAALRWFTGNERAEERIQQGIEQNRKGDFRVRITGIPDGTRVSYRLVNHAFRFGANLFMLDQYSDDRQNAGYRAAFPRTFNLATLPFYWKDQEPEQGKPRYAAGSEPIFRRPPTDVCLDYCLEQHIEPKAHCLNYDFFRPNWLKGATVAEHRRALTKRFAELAERYRTRIPSWEVTNETFNDPYDLYSDFYQQPDFVSWSFREAKRYFPGNRLIINDHTALGCMMLPHGDIVPNRGAYYVQIRELLRDPEIRLDSIGFQYHSFFPIEQEAELARYRYNPDNLFRILDEYAALGPKMQITEMTIPAYSTDPADEAVQAALLRATYRLFFSLPAMEAIVYWNLVDGGASGSENHYCGGLLRPNLTKKPAYEALEELLREWHTEGKTETAYGVASFRGFYGDYVLTVGQREYAISLTEDTPTASISIS